MSDVSIGHRFNESAFNYQTCNGWKDIKAQYKLIHSVEALMEGHTYEAQFIDDEDMTLLPHVHEKRE